MSTKCENHSAAFLQTKRIYKRHIIWVSIEKLIKLPVNFSKIRNATKNTRLVTDGKHLSKQTSHSAEKKLRRKTWLLINGKNGTLTLVPSTEENLGKIAEQYLFVRFSSTDFKDATNVARFLPRNRPDSKL